MQPNQGVAKETKEAYAPSENSYHFYQANSFKR